MADTAPYPGLSALVLAAGAARRFGAAKQLAAPGGVPLVRQALERAQLLVGDSLTVVLGARAAEIEPHLAHCPGRRLLHPGWQEGIGSSLAAGIRALPQDAGAVLVLLADQAAVSVADLTALADAWTLRPQRIAAAAYAGVTGVPAIFPQALFAQLAALSGDSGARALLARHPGLVDGLPMPSAALDIDTPADLARYEAMLASSR